jgi:hypothetical protein
LHYKNEKFIHNVIYIKKVKATPKKYPRDWEEIIHDC